MREVFSQKIMFIKGISNHRHFVNEIVWELFNQMFVSSCIWYYQECSLQAEKKQTVWSLLCYLICSFRIIRRRFADNPFVEFLNNIFGDSKWWWWFSNFYWKHFCVWLPAIFNNYVLIISLPPSSTPSYTTFSCFVSTVVDLRCIFFTLIILVSK